MGKFVNPFTDIGFKIIFGQPASKPFLITLLNELLAGEHRIEVVNDPLVTYMLCMILLVEKHQILNPMLTSQQLVQ